MRRGPAPAQLLFSDMAFFGKAFPHFGKTSRKAPLPSYDPLNDATVSSTSEDESFTVIEQQKSPQKLHQFPPVAESDSSYPTPYATATLGSQSSSSLPHALDGVPFQLSSSCRRVLEAGGAAVATTRSLEGLLEDVERRLETGQQLALRAAEFDFKLEKSVIESDITSTMRRMQLS